MAARSIFTICRVPDRALGWWVFARTEWGKGSSAGGLARDIPFKTRRAATAWIHEQFGNGVEIRYE
jgi:hypothetical protein